MTTTPATLIEELPAMPPPSFAPIFLVVSYYVGPGWTSRHWKIHPTPYTTQEGAELFAQRLSDYHLHRRIFRIG